MKIVCARCGAHCASEAWASAHCKPSRVALRTGYRTDSERHVEARKKVPARRRRAIALLGGEAFRKNRGLPAK